MTRLRGAGRTDVGLKRENNEDSFLVDDHLGLYLVADGMGGAASGEVASRITAETVAGYVKRFAGSPNKGQSPYDPNISPRANALMQAVHLANSEVHSAAGREARHKGMGSTLAVVMLDGDRVLAAHVGDSPIFRFQNKALEQLTIPHRLADDPKYKGMVNPEATIMGALGDTLTRAMGVREDVEPDLKNLPLENDTIFLICSDGLTDMVDQATIAKVLGLDRSIENKSKDLVDLALAGGGRDNVTVVLVEAGASSKIKGFLSRLTQSK